MNTKNLFLFVSLLILSACSSGGGGATPAPVPNAAPVVNAGVDVTIRLPADNVALDGTVSDDGQPAGAALSTAWIVDSGPAGATFADVNAVDTTVTFVSAGTYVLQLTADDTALQGSDTVTVIVEAAPALAVVTVTPSDAALHIGGTEAFNASGADQYGDPIAVTFTWSATGGTIDTAGNYIAGGVTGAFTVTATVGAVSGTANVTISDSPPTADAGGPYMGVQGAAVALDGSASTDANNDIVSYEWDLDNDGNFGDVTGVNAIYNAAGSGVFTIGLLVTDGDGATDSDTTTVTITNLAPTANAGPDQPGVSQGATVTLDGSGSSDPGGDALTYAWTLTSVPAGSTAVLSDATAIGPSFDTDLAGSYTAELVVNDGTADSAADTVTITVGNVAPTANAGPDQPGVSQGATVTLDGSASSDPGGDALTYAWTLTSVPAGSAAVLSDATAIGPSFDTDLVGSYTAELVVNDGTADSAADTVTITVDNVVPTADASAGAPYSGDQGADITLDGSASSDPSGIASYEWDLDNDGVFDNATGVNATFNSAAAGMFTVGLRVTDNDATNATTTVGVTVNDIAPAAPLGVSASGDDGQVSLDWADNTEPDIAGYHVLRSTTSGGPYVDVSGLIAPSTYADSSVVNGTTYFYVVTAEDAVIPNTSAQSAEVETTPNGVVHAFWTFDEGVGTTTVDTVAPDDGSGTVASAGSWTAGVSGTSPPDFALDFNGSSDNVVVDNTQSLKITGTKITMTAWIYPRDGGASVGSRVISKRTDAPGSDVFAMITDDYRLRFRLDGQDMVSSHIIQLDEWVHVAMVYDGADKRIYIDGVLDVATPQAKSDPIDASSRAVHLGTREADVNFFDGIIDEVQIYNRALSDADVLAIHGAVVPSDPAPGGLSFSDISVSAGIAGSADGGHGVMFAEVDSDNDPDFYLTNNLEFAGPLDDLYFDNLTGVTFAVDATAGIADNDGGSHGAVWADLDNDGDYDLFNGSTWGDSPNGFGNPAPDNIYENRLDEVEAAFVDVTPAILLAPNPIIETRGVTALDMDGDGDLDLFGVSSGKTGGITEAYRNDTNGTGVLAFSAYVDAALSNTVAMQGVTDTDYDNDGDIDILAANRLGDFVILRNGDTGGTLSTGIFTQIDPLTLNIIAFADQGKDGITTADVDNDGDLDLLFADGNGSNGYLYLWDNVLKRYDLKQRFFNVEGFMGGFADLDNDGWQDLVFAGDERVFMNTGNVVGTLFESGQSVPVSEIDDPRSIAFADIDGDGDLDFAIAAKASRNWLVSNDIDAAAGNWLSVRLVSPNGQVGAFGAKVSVRQLVANGGALIGMREAKGNHGYLAQDNQVLRFGLGSETAVDVTVDFVDDDCDGIVTEVLNQAANMTIDITGVCP